MHLYLLHTTASCLSHMSAFTVHLVSVVSLLVFLFVYFCTSAVLVDMDRCVVATGLSLDHNHEDLKKMFSSVGKVQKIVRVIHDTTKKFNGKAYIVYASQDSVSSAVMSLSKDKVKVQSLGEDKSEYTALVEGDEGEEEMSFIQQWEKFSMDQQFKMMKLMNPLKTPLSPGGASFFGDNTVVLQEKPNIPSFSGSGKDCSFGRWKYEVDSLDKNEKYSDITVMEAVKKSLKTPAADCLPHLGVSPTLSQVIRKIESMYGSVLSGEALLEKFYRDEQGSGETCAQWSCRLEDVIFQAAQKGALSNDAVPSTLKNKFWSGLLDSNIKNALRHKYKEVEFTELLEEARSIEAESGSSQKKDKAKSQQVTGEDSKFDLLLKKMEAMEADIKHLKEDKKTEEKRKGPLICPKCNLVGHFSWGCKQGQDFTCARCKQKGHIPKACRNKKSSLNTQ